MDGLILLNKPEGLTSHDVVDEVRKRIKQKKVGHFGTLDPLATGLLLLAVGKATRLFPFFSKLDKVYQGEIKFGFATNTYDSQGEAVSEQCFDYPAETALITEKNKFKGELNQVPPPFSAKKYKGKALYTLARQNITVKLDACPIHVHYFQINSYAPPLLDFNIKCSSGTYIRSIAHELGQALGCGAHLFSLKRTKIGEYDLKQSLTLEDFLQLPSEAKILSHIIPLESLLPHFPKIILTEIGSTMAKNGNTIFAENLIKILTPESILADSPENTEKIFRLFSPDGKLLALARREAERKGGLHPFIVIDNQ